MVRLSFQLRNIRTNFWGSQLRWRKKRIIQGSVCWSTNINIIKRSIRKYWGRNIKFARLNLIRININVLRLARIFIKTRIGNLFELRPKIWLRRIIRWCSSATIIPHSLGIWRIRKVRSLLKGWLIWLKLEWIWRRLREAIGWSTMGCRLSRKMRRYRPLELSSYFQGLYQEIVGIWSRSWRYATRRSY